MRVLPGLLGTKRQCQPLRGRWSRYSPSGLCSALCPGQGGATGWTRKCRTVFSTELRSPCLGICSGNVETDINFLESVVPSRAEERWGHQVSARSEFPCSLGVAQQQLLSALWGPLCLACCGLAFWELGARGCRADCARDPAPACRPTICFGEAWRGPRGHISARRLATETKMTLVPLEGQWQKAKVHMHSGTVT